MYIDMVGLTPNIKNEYKKTYNKHVYIYTCLFDESVKEIFD